MNASAPVIVISGSGNIIGGREIMTLMLARGLRDAGYRVVFFTSAWIGQGEFISRLRAEGFEFYTMRLGFIAMSLRLKPLWWTLDQLRYLPSLMLQYRRRIRQVFPVLVIHTNWHHALLLMPLLNRQRDIYWSHEVVPASRHYGAAFRAISRRIWKIVCVSNAVANVFASHGIAREKLLVIHNAIQQNPQAVEHGNGSRLRLGLIGQIGAWKGHEEALEALALLKDEVGRVILKIFGAGDPAYISALKTKATTLGVEKNIEWCGFISDQDSIFGEIDVCLMPSRVSESFGLSALEAGIYGKPVICSAMGALPEIVEDGVTGFVLSQSEKPELLAAAITKFLQHPEQVSIMGMAAQARVSREFSYSRFIGKFVELAERRIAA